MNIERNCLSYWCPKIRDAGLPVPRTIIVTMPDELRESMMQVLDGKPYGRDTEPFFAHLRAAVNAIGTPCFLRTGQTSGKHQWKETCYLTDVNLLEQHVGALMNYSELCGMFGLPWNVWCVREFLETSSPFDLDEYGGMPVAQEFRCFVRDGSVECIHPYWPKGAILDGMRVPESIAGKPLRYLLSSVDAAYERLIDGIDDPELVQLASAAGNVVKGDWSVDILSTEDGWFVTDMATASDSFHWEGCPNAEVFAAVA